MRFPEANTKERIIKLTRYYVAYGLSLVSVKLTHVAQVIDFDGEFNASWMRR